MPHIAEQLLDDHASGLKTDAGGRRYFRQRRVVFRTIGLEAEDIYDGAWLGFEQALAPLDWSGWPTHADLREYSRLSSERFLAFWYRVLDVTVARALSGRGKEIFRTEFFRSSPLLDLGIPAEQKFSTVPEELHRKIIREYRRSRELPVRLRVFYLSDYLTGLTDDVREALMPYARLWDLHGERRDLLRRLDELPRKQKEIWRAYDSNGDPLRARLARRLDAYLLQFLARVPADQVRTLASETLRHLLYRLRAGHATQFSSQDRMEIFRCESQLGLPPAAGLLFLTLGQSKRLAELVRSALVQNSAAYRLDLRLTRLQYLYRQHGLETSTDSVRRRRAVHRKSFGERVLVLQQEFLEPTRRALHARRLRALHILAERLNALDAQDADELPFERILLIFRAAFESANENETTQDPEDETAIPVQAELDLMGQAFELLLRIRATESEIVKIHHEFARAVPPEQSAAYDQNQPGAEDEPPPTTRLGPGDARYQSQEFLEVPRELVVGNPFHEYRILQYARDLLLRRLRPVRRTTSYYSLNPGHRHGAITLNPIMKLWKDRPQAQLEEGARSDTPTLAGLEINTRQTIECLVRLGGLVDPALEEREINRYRTLREKRGVENLANLSFFLLPGSAFPLREIHRLDFPEFRGRVIGESRAPGELGVPPEEDAVLTGAWYQKNNHTLYVPVGGDNGGLVRLIWQSGRSPGPPAFFFALGQMVHDCLPENLTYFRSGEVTFRECIEDYYLAEDRIRKNRGEKTGRRRIDNSRPAIRFMFAVCYARLALEALTGSSQSHFRHPPTERWLGRHIGLPLLNSADRGQLKQIRSRARELIREYDE